MPSLHVVISVELDARLQDAVEKRGYKDKSEFVRQAIRNELLLPGLRYQVAAVYETLNQFLSVFLYRNPRPPADLASSLGDDARVDSSAIRENVARRLSASSRPVDKRRQQAVSAHSAQAESDNGVSGRLDDTSHAKPDENSG